MVEVEAGLLSRDGATVHLTREEVLQIVQEDHGEKARQLLTHILAEMTPFDAFEHPAIPAEQFSLRNVTAACPEFDHKFISEQLFYFASERVGLIDVVFRLEDGEPIPPTSLSRWLQTKEPVLRPSTGIALASPGEEILVWYRGTPELKRIIEGLTDV